jgi:peptidoglycan/xylan/chitin deacetylase (PgdA/CDA1 family)
MFYLIKTPWWLKRLYADCIWQMPVRSNTLYLTFDDGPHPVITPFVLNELEKYNAQATFFCIGNNVARYPEIYKRILEEGHAVGNHTYDHLNGWKTTTGAYLDNIEAAKKWIISNLFRPPYGKTTYAQLRALQKKDAQFKTIMWSILSGDFDKRISPQQCYVNVMKHTKPGAIIVFHDSEKAYERMSYALPMVLDYFSKKGFRFEKI